MSAYWVSIEFNSLTAGFIISLVQFSLGVLYIIFHFFSVIFFFFNFFLNYVFYFVFMKKVGGDGDQIKEVKNKLFCFGNFFKNVIFFFFLKGLM